MIGLPCGILCRGGDELYWGGELTTTCAPLLTTTGELPNILGGFLITDLAPSGSRLTDEGGLLDISGMFLTLVPRVYIPGRLFTVVLLSCDMFPADTTGGNLMPSICLDRLVLFTAVVTSCGSSPGGIFRLLAFSTSPEEYDLLSLVRRRFLMGLGNPEFADFDGRMSTLELILSRRLSKGGGLLGTLSTSVVLTGKLLCCMAASGDTLSDVMDFRLVFSLRSGLTAAAAAAGSTAGGKFPMAFFDFIAFWNSRSTQVST